jgi:hypothetical protein
MDTTRDHVFSLFHQLQGVRVLDFIKFPPESRQTVEHSIRELCHIFSAADAGMRSDIASYVDHKFSFAFLWFAKLMAEKAIRESCPEAIWEGLMAILIENFAYDVRDTVPRLVLLHHSATKIGLDCADLFARASKLAVSEKASRIVHDFPQWPTGRGLGSYLYEETGSGASFIYRKLGDDALF